MPPKKAAATAAPAKRNNPRAARTHAAEPETNGATKAAVPANSAKTTKATKETTKAAPKRAAAAATKKEPLKKPNKRKASESVSSDEEVEVAPAKRAKTTAEKEAPAPKKTAAKKEKSQSPAAKPVRAPVSKKPRTTVVINTAPTDLLDVYVFGDGTNGELGLGDGKGCAEVKRPRLNPNLAADKVGVVNISVGGMHTAVLTKDNKILTWGVNDQGALGRDTAWDGGLRDIADEKSDDSDSDDESTTGLNPKESNPGEVDLSSVPEDTVWTQVAASDSATFTLANNGLVYGCGTFRSNEGIFGFSEHVLIQRTLTLIPELKKITKLVAGANHVLALDNKGHVYAWGSGQQNQLGRRVLERFMKNSLKPTQFGLPKGKIVDVGAGAYHSFAMHQNGDLYSWGLNSFGETGITDNFEAEGESDVHAPKVVKLPEQFGHVVQVEGGSHHTIARTDKGEVLVWGRLDGGQLGLKISDISAESVIRDSSDKPRILKVPTQVPNIDAIAVAAGSDHSIAVAKDGKAYSWGFSTNYQTGLGTDEDVEVATHIDNTATRGKQLIWAGAGGQFSALAGRAQAAQTNGVNGHA